MWRTVAVAAALAGAAGCGGQKLEDVAGTVTYDGKPLPAGVVWFDPVGSHGMETPQGYGTVRDGRFDTADGGRGVRAGPYLVRIEGFDGKPAGEFPLGKPLFTDFQEKRDLPPGRVELEFAVPKAGKGGPPKP